MVPYQKNLACQVPDGGNLSAAWNILMFNNRKLMWLNEGICPEG
jgi:hypothetical protein